MTKNLLTGLDEKVDVYLTDQSFFFFLSFPYVVCLCTFRAFSQIRLFCAACLKLLLPPR